MGLSIDLHRVSGISAKAHRGQQTQWVELSFNFYPWGPPTIITVFMTNYETAKLYADAINNAEIAKVPELVSA